MKILTNIKVFCLGLTLLVWASGCQNEAIVDFGFDGSFTGTVVDQNGNVVAGNITNNNLVVRALGERDQVSTDMRVDGDGTFGNTKLYPKKYKIWISGPVTMLTDTMVIDFAKEKIVMRDLEVVPFLSVAPPELLGSPSSSSVEIRYNITGNEGKVSQKRELYLSTNPYPDASTGSGPFFHSKVVALPTDAGTVSVEGLTAKTKYFVRIGAQAAGATGINYSEQIIINTP